MRGMDLIKELMICRKAGTTVMIRRIRTIRNNRATKTLSAPPMGIKLIDTMRKSNMFQPSLKKFTRERSAKIRIKISMVKNMVME